MNETLSILDAIKKYGILGVIGVSGFLYLLNRVNTLEEKYEACMNERVNDAYKMRYNTSEQTEEATRYYAVLTEPVKVRKRESDEAMILTENHPYISLGILSLGAAANEAITFIKDKL